MQILNNLKQLIKEKIKIESIYKLAPVIVLFIILNLLISFSFLNKLENSIIKDIHEESYSKIKIGITEYIKRQNLSLDNITDNIIDDINEYYNDDSILKEDLHNFHEESSIVNIFRDNVKGLSNIIIMNSDKVLLGNFYSYNMNSINNKEYFNIDINTFYSNFKNSSLVKDSFEFLFELEPLKNDIILGFERVDTDINEFNFESIYDYLNGDLRKIENFYFISYSYLTETADIFDVPDYDIYGNPVKNDKIVIVKLFSYLDLDNEELITEINKHKEKIELIEMQFENIKYICSIVTFITCFTFGILIIAMIMSYNKRLKEVR